MAAFEFWFWISQIMQEKFNKSFKTAVATIFAPTYAMLVIGYLQLQVYKKRKNEFGVNNGKYIEENYIGF